MSVIFASLTADVSVKFTLGERIGDPARFVILGDDNLVTDSELLWMAASLLPADGWYEVAQCD